MEWQPISDVPKELRDGAYPFLLWSPSTHSYPLFGRYWAQGGIWEEDADHVACLPTHWMFLPEPPK